MPTQNQIDRIGIAAQEIIDGQEFSKIRADIERVAEGASDGWNEARLCKLSSTAAYDHLITTVAIKSIVTGYVADIPSDISTFERYISRGHKKTAY